MALLPKGGNVLPGGEEADLVSGKVPIAQLPTGATASTVALGNHTHSGLLTGSATAVNNSAAAPTQSEFNALLTALRARGIITGT